MKCGKQTSNAYIVYSGKRIYINANVSGTSSETTMKETLADTKKHERFMCTRCALNSTIYAVAIPMLFFAAPIVPFVVMFITSFGTADDFVAHISTFIGATLLCCTISGVATCFFVKYQRMSKEDVYHQEGEITVAGLLAAHDTERLYYRPMNYFEIFPEKKDNDDTPLE